MRQKISDKLYLKFAEWSDELIQEDTPRRSLLTLQKWLLGRMRLRREVETFSSTQSIKLSQRPKRSKQTGSIDPVEDESDSDTDPNHTVILTYPSGKQVRYNQQKGKYYRYKPFHGKELSHSASMCTSTNTNAVVLQTLICNLSGRKGRKGSKIVALLDPGSTQTFVDKETAVTLKLKRTSKPLDMIVNVFNQQVKIDSYRLELHLTSTIPPKESPALRAASSSLSQSLAVTASGQKKGFPQWLHSVRDTEPVLTPLVASCLYKVVTFLKLVSVLS